MTRRQLNKWAMTSIAGLAVAFSSGCSRMHQYDDLPRGLPLSIDLLKGAEQVVCLDSGLLVLTNLFPNELLPGERHLLYFNEKRVLQSITYFPCGHILSVDDSSITGYGIGNAPASSMYREDSIPGHSIHLRECDREMHRISNRIITGLKKEECSFVTTCARLESDFAGFSLQSKPTSEVALTAVVSETTFMGDFFFEFKSMVITRVERESSRRHAYNELVVLNDSVFTDLFEELCRAQ